VSRNYRLEGEFWGARWLRGKDLGGNRTTVHKGSRGFGMRNALIVGQKEEKISSSGSILKPVLADILFDVPRLDIRLIGSAPDRLYITGRTASAKTGHLDQDWSALVHVEEPVHAGAPVVSASKI
jgi:hypothetical protein